MTENLFPEVTAPAVSSPVPYRPEFGLQTIDVSEIDQLDDAEEIPLELASEYWTPANPGEYKKIVFDRIDMSDVPDLETGEATELKCAFFFGKDPATGMVKQYRNGSKRLVGALESFTRGAALKITYLGKQKNRSNTYYSDNWSIRPIRVRVNAE